MNGARWSPPPAQHLLIDVSVINNDSIARAVGTFTLVDEHDSVHRRSIVDVPNSLPSDLEINPGITEHAVLVFRVPQDRSYRLRVWDGVFWETDPAWFQIEPGQAR